MTKSLIITHPAEGSIDINALFLIANVKQDKLIEHQEASRSFDKRHREFSPRIGHLQDQFHGKLYDLVAANLDAPEPEPTPESTVEDAPEDVPEVTAEDVPEVTPEMTPEDVPEVLNHRNLFWIARGKNHQKIYSKHRPRREVELPLRVEHLNILILRKLRKVLRHERTSRKRPSTSEATPTPAKQVKKDPADFTDVTYVSTTSKCSEDVKNSYNGYQEIQDLFDIETAELRYQLKKQKMREIMLARVKQESVSL